MRKPSPKTGLFRVTCLPRCFPCLVKATQGGGVSLDWSYLPFPRIDNALRISHPLIRVSGFHPLIVKDSRSAGYFVSIDNPKGREPGLANRSTSRQGSRQVQGTARYQALGCHQLLLVELRPDPSLSRWYYPHFSPVCLT